MHHYLTLLLWSIGCLILSAELIQAQYDDEITPYKVRLEDLETNNDARIKQELPEHQTPLKQQGSFGYTHLPDIRKQSLPVYEHTGEPIDLTALQSNYAHLKPNPPPQMPSAENRYPQNFASFAHNIIDDDANDEQQRPQATHTPIGYHQPADDRYPLKQLPSAYVLVPPFNEVDDENEISTEHNHLPPPARPQRPPPPPPRPTSIVSFEPSAPSAPPVVNLPSRPTPPPPPQTIAAAQTLHNGVRYVDDNQLQLQKYNDDEYDAPQAHIYSPQYFLPGRPRIIYGQPPRDNDMERPIHLPTQGNQFAYAPVRRPDASAPPTAAAILPYPPSFISITTRPPTTESQGSASGRPAYYGRQFRPSPVDPVPDIFANRQHKSLLDSYIPSWVVAQMIQQQQQQQQRANYGAHTLAYPVNSPFNRNFKRELKLKSERKSTEGGKKIVKKSLEKQSKKKEEMVMTE